MLALGYLLIELIHVMIGLIYMQDGLIYEMPYVSNALFNALVDGLMMHVC
jgi:hypothetical protein